MIVTKEIHVTGMQCGGCETIIEEVVSQIDGVLYVKADYLHATLKVRFNKSKTNLEIFQKICSSSGYTLLLIPEPSNQKRLKVLLSVLAFTVLVALIFLTRSFGHQLKLPVINSQTSDALIFVVGLFTGLHCVGMCGSFIIGYTTNDAERSHSIFRSHLLYGAGKTLSYAMFGMLFGFAGSLFRITPVIGGISLGLAGLFLILCGLNMLNIFKYLKFVRIKLPIALTRNFSKRSSQSHSPFFIGFFSGFILGCGPLQVMYVMAAGNGNAFEGAKILTLFGLGTLPALLGFGFLTRLLSNKMTRSFIHASGIILIFLGSMMLNMGLIRTRTGEDLKTIHPCCQEQVDPM
jgi:sulfite exporter TauE/SafE/copper chaperone CopZ